MLVLGTCEKLQVFRYSVGDMGWKISWQCPIVPGLDPLGYS